MNNTKTIEKIIKSKEAPKNTNVIWLDLNENDATDNPLLKVFNDGEWVHITAQQYVNEQDIKDLTEKVDLLKEDVRDCETKVDYCEGLITECSKFKSSDTSNIMIDTTLTGTQLNGMKMNDALNKILFKEEEPAIVEQLTLEVEYDPYVEIGTSAADLFNSIKIKQKEKLVYNYGCKSFTGNKADTVEKNVDLYGECTLTNIAVSSNRLNVSGTFSLVYDIEDAGYSVCSRKGVVPEDNHPVGELRKQLNNLLYIVYIPFYYKKLDYETYQHYLTLMDNPNKYISNNELNKLKVITNVNEDIVFSNDSCFALFVPENYAVKEKYNFNLCVNGINLYFKTARLSIDLDHSIIYIYDAIKNTASPYIMYYVGCTLFPKENLTCKLIIK